MTKFLSINQIRKLCGYGYPKAKKLYDIANKIEDLELGKYRVETKKVRLSTVERILEGRI